MTTPQPSHSNLSGREESLDDGLVAGCTHARRRRGAYLLEAGAGPDVVGADGLPVPCPAVTAFDEPVAAALVEGGADQNRLLPDGTTPLLRAVELGSPAVVTAFLGHELQPRLPQTAQERLLTLARNWYETGAAEELRRRARTSGCRWPLGWVMSEPFAWKWLPGTGSPGL